MRFRTAALSVSVLGLLASGCSTSEAGPRSLPTLTSTPTPTPTRSPVVVPADARANTAQGADAFVRFFFAQLNVAFSTSDPTIIREMSNDECQTCANYAKALDASRADKEFLVGDSFVVIDVAAAPLQARGTIVEVLGRTPARQIVDAAGRVVTQLPVGGKFHMQVAVKRQVSGWLVSGMRLANS